MLYIYTKRQNKLLEIRSKGGVFKRRQPYPGLQVSPRSHI